MTDGLGLAGLTSPEVDLINVPVHIVALYFPGYAYVSHLLRYVHPSSLAGRNFAGLQLVQCFVLLAGLSLS